MRSIDKQVSFFILQKLYIMEWSNLGQKSSKSINRKGRQGFAKFAKKWKTWSYL